MPVQELINFREKYPEYKDIDDVTLANKLASKYPDAYGDLPSKVSTTPSQEENISNQTNPATWKKYVSQGAKTVLPAVGSVVGGLVGTAAGTPFTPVGMGAGALAGGGIGYAAGEQGSRIVDELLGLSQPKSLGQQLVQTGQDIVTGAALEATGQIGGKLITEGVKKIAAPYAARLTGEAKEVARIAKENGVELTAGEITGSKTLGLVEKSLAFVPGSSDVMQRSTLKQLDSLVSLREKVLDKVSQGKGVPESLERVGIMIQDKVEKIVASARNLNDAQKMALRNELLLKAGSTESYETLGMKAQEALAANSAKAVAKKHELYREVGKAIPDGDYPTENLSNTAKDVLKEIEQLPSQDSTLKNVLKWAARHEDNIESKQILDGISGYPPDLQRRILQEYNIDPTAISQPVARNWETLQNFRSQLSELIKKEDLSIKMGNPSLKGQLTNEGRIYKDLQKKLDLDMEEIARQSGTDAWEKLQVANRFYKEDYAPIWKNKDIQRLAYAKPEKIVDMVFKPGNLSEINVLKKAVDKPTFDSLRKKWVASVLDDAVKGGEFTWDRVAKGFEPYMKDGTINSILLPHEQRQLLAYIQKGLTGENKPIADKFLLDVLRKSTPDTVMNMVFHKNNAGNINKIRQAIGGDLFAQAKTLWTEKMLKTSELGVYRPLPTIKGYSGIDESTLNAIYNKEERTFLDKMLSLSKYSQRVEQLAGNPSGTAQSVITFQQGRAIFSKVAEGRLDKATVIFFLPKVLAKIYMSPSGRKYFTEGLKTPALSKRGTEIATKLSAIAGQNMFEETEEGGTQ